MTKIYYKAFDKDLKCRDFQYEVGKEYTHKGEVEACQSGFHSCENPLDVLNYYDLTESRFCEVEVGGNVDKKSDDSKVASEKIKIKAELKLGDFINTAISYIKEKCFKDEKVQSDSGDSAQLAASGNSAKLAASGYSAQLAASGKNSVIAGVGYDNKVKGVNGTLVCLVEFDNDYKPLRFVTGKIGENGLKENTWYIAKDGQFIEY